MANTKINWSVPVWYVAYGFDSGTVCGQPELFNDQKSLKKTKKLILIVTHLLYRSHNIVDHVKSGKPHTIPTQNGFCSKLIPFILLCPYKERHFMAFFFDWLSQQTAKILYKKNKKKLFTGQQYVNMSEVCKGKRLTVTLSTTRL